MDDSTVVLAKQPILPIFFIPRAAMGHQRSENMSPFPPRHKPHKPTAA